MTILLPFAVALLAGLVLVRVSMRLAPRLGLVVHPRPDRWGERPVPSFGGMAVVGAVVLGTATAGVIGALDPVDAIATIALVSVLFALGVADDRGSVAPVARLVIEAIAGAGFTLVVAGGQPPVVLVAGVALAVVAVPLIVNATNLVDNADGLAAALSAVTAGTLVAAPAAVGLPLGVAVPIAIIGSAIAFLQVNRPPALTFMGDGGSLGLGGALAASAILLVDAALTAGPVATIATVAIIVLSVMAQLVDVALVVISRVRRGSSPFQGGTDHTSHRLLRAGFSAGGMLVTIVIVACALAAMGLIAGSLAAHGALYGVLLAVVAIGLAIALEIVVAHRFPATPSADLATPKPATGPVLPGSRRPEPETAVRSVLDPSRR